MSHTGSTRSSLRAVAFLVGLLAVVLLGPGSIEAARPAPLPLLVVIAQSYIFAPTGVTVGQEVRLVYHNLTKTELTVNFLLLDANGHDLFVANKIKATMTVAAGKMGVVFLPSDQILGPNQTRAEVTGVVALAGLGDPTRPHQLQPFNARCFVGPASLQLVDELTQRTLLTVGAVTPLAAQMGETLCPPVD